MQIPIYQVDAFSSRLFGGNPAAVCPLERWLPDGLLQSIAAENNLAETAFYVPVDGGYHLRWFTPAVEIDLCGHATLATAHVILTHFDRDGAEVRFQTLSGELRVTREGDLYSLDFPSRPPTRCNEIQEQFVEALGVKPLELWIARDHMAVFESEEDVRGIRPHMDKLASAGGFATIVTAPGDSVDFVSRFFAPAQGIPEDPVTGSAHCTLIPYWAQRLGKTSLHARQISPRGGELFCEDLGERVRMSGHAASYLTGTIHL